MTKITPKLLHAIAQSKLTDLQMIDAIQPKEDPELEAVSHVATPRRGRGNRHSRRDMRAES